jgi:hypothetical protein
VAPLSASGNVRDLFAMEDVLYAQLQNLLPAPPPEVAQTNPPQVVNNYIVEGQEAPQDEYPAANYAYPAPEYDYGYSGLGYISVGPYLYGYPGFYGGAGFYRSGFNRGGFYGGFRGNVGLRGGNLGLRGGSFGGGGIRVSPSFRGGFGGGIRAGGFGAGGRR